MIISTSSQDVQLTENICEYVESVLRDELRHVADRVVSIDARLENDANAVMRVDLDDRRALLIETQGKNLRTAIRRGAAESARAVDQHLRLSREGSSQRQATKYLAFGRYSAANI